MNRPRNPPRPGGAAAVAIAAAIVAVLSVPADSRSETPAAAVPDKDAVRKIVRKYLLEHSEVTEAAIPVLQAWREARNRDRVRAVPQEQHPDLATVRLPR